MTAIRDRWLAPADPGPRTRDRLVVLAVAGLAAVAWLANVHDARSRLLAPADRATYTLELDAEGDARGGFGDERRDLGSVELRDAGVGARYAVVDVDLPERAARPLDVKLDLPPGTRGESVALRVVASGRLRRRHAKDGTPRVRVASRERDAPVRVVLALPADQLELDPGERVAGALSELTGPIDATIVEQRRDARRLADLREWATWFALAIVALGTALPLLAWTRVQRRFRRVRSGRVPAKEGMGRPDDREPLQAAAIVAGVHDVDPGDALAAVVLHAAVEGRVQLRRALVPDRGSGTFVRLRPDVPEASEPDDADAGVADEGDVSPGEGDVGAGTSQAAPAAAASAVAAPGTDPVALAAAIADMPPLLRAAAELVELSDPELTEDGTAWLPDDEDVHLRQLDRVPDARRAVARARWRDAVRDETLAMGMVEHAPWLVVRACLAASVAVAVLAAVVAVLADGPGSTSTWTLVAAFAAPTVAGCALWWHDARRWRRVRAAWAPTRARWQAWRRSRAIAMADGDPATAAAAAMATESGASGPLLPWLAALGVEPRPATQAPALEAVGIAAATPRTIAALRRIAQPHRA